ncbi:thiol-disulfide oxidoreductase [Chryseobacterium sp. P1-3]|uniref:Thiol-disulfide oxidoreductase n=1 Tax=Chryseobacterium gallinarum TaxID=1324352 RepID=A0A0G3M1B2_CHRGL|nr:MULTISPECIES: DCC1-like thiol-disulfide oxidoreductase family protein [Chryseobacterium]AKK71783.1 thiol-disulfide oxidoreductase [Chryseobacterium gallinarum]KFF75269.1 thiol-disulfide oxidoreductase [Chryseobacterium sp. P1-3]MCL8535402.1 DCC1-like thiol-disulfide oxidoreductase family protein [Chryseobacterium gallinarum]
MENWENKHIVFFDGNCGVCNFWVQWILERDKKDKFMFASLQSGFGQQFLSERGLETKVFNTLYLWKPHQYYLIKSKAVLEIANMLGGIYRLSIIGKIIPAFLSDQLYDIISKNRMKLANQKCFLPDEHQKKKFIQV